jgi:hypothetical protein
MRRSVPGRALAALAFLAVLAFPSIAAAHPRQAPQKRTPAERATEVGVFTRFWSGWAHLWSQEGSGLDPDGKASTGAPGGRGALPAGNTGWSFDPNGK